jgi:hypothetical protein
MSQPTESPGTAVPGSAPENDVSRQIGELTDAVNRLVQAQQQPQRRPPHPNVVAPRDVGGDIPGGTALLPGVDYARLSPLQQIALGLRDAKPLGVARPEVRGESANDDDASAHGAD